MSQKRYIEDESGGTINKKLKKIEFNLNDMLNMIDVNDIETAFKYLIRIFPRMSYIQLPPIIYVNQLYSLIKSKTCVDRGLEILKIENKIILFPCDTGLFEQSDICICEKSEFVDYVRNLIKSHDNFTNSFNIDKERVIFLIDLFTNKILNEVSTFGISSLILKNVYKLNEKDLTCLVKLGLLLLKDSDNFWISIPGMSQFKQDLTYARICFKSIIRKKQVL